MANEKRLIDANALLAKLRKTSRYFSIKFDIEEAPTVDAVEVVRCKDCKWYENAFCYHHGQKCLGVDRDHFCSYGERKDNE